MFRPNLLVLAVILAVGCGKKPDLQRQKDGSELVGTVWVGGYKNVIKGVVGKDVVGENTFAFKSMGQVVRSSKFFGTPDVLEDEGTWKLEGDTIKMVITAGDKAYPQEFSYDGKRMWNASTELRRK